MTPYSIKQGTIKFVKKTEIYALKTASKEVVDKKAEATGKLLGNKVNEQIVRPKLCVI